MSNEREGKVMESGKSYSSHRVAGKKSSGG